MFMDTLEVLLGLSWWHGFANYIPMCALSPSSNGFPPHLFSVQLVACLSLQEDELFGFEIEWHTRQTLKNGGLGGNEVVCPGRYIVCHPLGSTELSSWGSAG